MMNNLVSLQKTYMNVESVIIEKRFLKRTLWESGA